MGMDVGFSRAGATRRVTTGWTWRLPNWSDWREVQRHRAVKQGRQTRKLLTTLEQTQSEVHRVAAKVEAQEARKQKDVYSVLGRIYAAYRLSLLDPEATAAFLEAQGVERNRRTTPHYALTKALFPADGWQTRRSLVSQWAKVVHAAEVAEVAGDTDAVVRWLRREEDVEGNGKLVSGYAKADRVLHISSGRIGRRVARTIAKRTAEEQEFERVIAGMPWARRDGEKHRPESGLAAGYMLVLAKNVAGWSKMVGVVEDREKIVRSVVLRAWKEGSHRGT